MNLKRLALAAAAGTSLLAAAPAFADPPHWAPAYGWRAQHPHHYRPRPVVIYAPAPYSYYYPPVYYAPPRPVIYGRIPVGPDVRIGFRVGL